MRSPPSQRCYCGWCCRRQRALLLDLDIGRFRDFAPAGDVGLHDLRELLGGGADRVDADRQGIGRSGRDGRVRIHEVRRGRGVQEERHGVRRQREARARGFAQDY